MRSSASWSAGSRPLTASASSPFTFATAFVTPLPAHASPPSRSSTASNSPVDAPEGTAARPEAPDFKRTSTSTRRVSPAVEDLTRVYPIDAAQPDSTSRLYSSAARRSASSGSSPACHDLLDRGQQAVVRPKLVAGGGGTLQDLLRIERRGQRLRDLTEDLAAALVLALDLVPVAHHVAGRLGGPVAEHVRVAANQLLRGSARPPRRGCPARAPRAAATGSRPGTARRPARRAAWRRRPSGPRPRARRPPRPCAGTIERSSCSRSQGHSRRSLRVISSSRSSAAERSLTLRPYGCGFCGSLRRRVSAPAAAPPGLPPEAGPVSVSSFGAFLHSATR